MLNNNHYDFIGNRAAGKANGSLYPGASSGEQEEITRLFHAVQTLKQADAALRAAQPPVAWGGALAKFRQGQQQQKRSPLFFLAWGGVPAAALTVLLFITLNGSLPTSNMASGLQHLSSDELKEIAVPYDLHPLELTGKNSSPLQEASLDEAMLAELNLSPDDAAQFIDEEANGYAELLNELSPEEIEALYANTIVKKKEG